MRPRHQSLILAMLLLMWSVASASAQVGGTPASPTLWSFLGIPQGVQKLQGTLRNRRGNRPGREPKPPLKALADPANLESGNPAIKKAAEIKQAEDLKKQKIKAIKYLAGIGCGCYDIDGSITDAMVAAMGDCTEDVRLATVKAIAKAAGKGCCSQCGAVCCCNKDVLMQLAKMAYDRDDHGCYVEPSERVRQEAAEAIKICCPNDLAPVIIEEDEPETRETVKEDEPETKPRETGDGLEDIPPGIEESSREGGLRGSTVKLRYAESILPYSRDKAFLANHQVMVGLARQQVPALSNDQAEPLDGPSQGTVVNVNLERHVALVRCETKNVPAAVGSRIRVYRNVQGVRTLVGELEVVESFSDSLKVSGTAECLAALSSGDVIRLSSQKTGGLQRVENATNSMAWQ